MPVSDPVSDKDERIARPIDASPRLLRLVDAWMWVILSALVAFVIWRGDYGLRFWIGIALAAVGIPLWVLARVQLGSSFSVGAQARRLVTTGLYVKFRNPIYLFGGIVYVGLFIALGNWIFSPFFSCCARSRPAASREKPKSSKPPSATNTVAIALALGSDAFAGCELRLPI